MVVITAIIVITLVWVGRTIWQWISKELDFFEKLGIPYFKPSIYFKNGWRIVRRKATIRDLILEAYNEYPDAPIVGSFDQFQPSFIIRDPELIKQIGIKDFDHFVDHRVMIDEEVEPLFGNTLMALHGQKWKDMRGTLSPMFTGSKMRQMFELISDIGEQMAEYFKTVSKEERIVEFKEICSQFANDVIATAAFGIQVDSFKNKENEFYQSGKRLLDFGSIFVAIRMMFFIVFPKIGKALKLKIMPDSKTNFFTTLLTETMRVREEKGIVRQDLIHLLLQSRKGILTTDSIQEKDESFGAFHELEVKSVDNRRKWTDVELLGQCFMFFVAGYEPISGEMSFLAYELATNLDVQKKLIEEVDMVYDELNGSRFTYDALKSMKYMTMVLTESLRHWPVEMADRMCTKDYKIKNEKGEEFLIKKGQNIMFPIVGIHFDPKYYENPEKFDPERFSDENKHNINPATYLPFGVGPRHCIGFRFALMEIKCAFYYLLLNFTIEVCEKTQVPLQLAKGFGMRAEKGIWLELKPRQK